MMMDFATLDRVRGVLQNRPDLHLTMEQQQRARDGIVRGIFRNPLYTRYKQHLQQPNARNTEPWQALGEQVYTALICMDADMPGSQVQIEGNIRSRMDSDGLPGMWIAVQCLSASPYLWLEKVRQVCLAAPLPRHVISREVLPFPLMFWSYETAHHVLNGPDEDDGLDWALIADAAQGFLVLTNQFVRRTGKMLIKGGVVPYGRVYPDEFTGIELESVAHVLKQLAFMSSPFTEIQSERLPRYIRREMAQAEKKKPDHEPTVNVIVLRRAAAEAHANQKQADVASREWRHQWWVSGHYRAQWYPSLKAHKVIWVAPHLKGPGDKPVLEKVYAVVR